MYRVEWDHPGLTDVINDDMVLLHLQYSTQWDTLAHVGALFDADGGHAALLSDGLHLSAAGSRRVFELLLPLLPAPDALPLDFPLWRDAVVGGDAAFAPLAIARLRAAPFAMPPRPAVPPGAAAKEAAEAAAAEAAAAEAAAAVAVGVEGGSAGSGAV